MPPSHRVNSVNKLERKVKKIINFNGLYQPHSREIKLAKKGLPAGILFGLLLVFGCAKDNSVSWDGWRDSYCDSLRLTPEILKAQIAPENDSVLWEQSQRYLREGRPQEAIWTLSNSATFAQEVAEERQKLRQVLETDSFEITDKKPGGSNPKKVIRFANGVEAIFKPNTENTTYVSVEGEMAAYELDDLLDFRVVPMTVRREVNGVSGSLQYFLSKVEGGKTEYISHPYFKRLKVLDYLISNRDRQIGNLMYWPEGDRLVAIDNGATFQDRECDQAEVIKGYLTYENQLKMKINQVSLEAVRNRLSPILEKTKVDRVLDRISKLKD